MGNGSRVYVWVPALERENDVCLLEISLNGSLDSLRDRSSSCGFLVVVSPRIKTCDVLNAREDRTGIPVLRL